MLREGGRGGEGAGEGEREGEREPKAEPPNKPLLPVTSATHLHRIDSRVNRSHRHTHRKTYTGLSRAQTIDGTLYKKDNTATTMQEFVLSF